MLKVVIKDRCVLKKWLYIYLSIYIIGHHHVKSSFGANKSGISVFLVSAENGAGINKKTNITYDPGILASRHDYIN